ncbi:hypothetical protein J2X03_003812 [Microbacterium trichothecenolyticum]|uniref:hypothetical protein n=1 Tax=Microbacterium trichothecenolyticum TaxID=69370 RepID=UPI00285471E5|nr:hypothetical protein [Microbacterium trichothecenolyticum]MDR7113910.1 hypothetical protein [Microbacterium trichothecenolyticum]
MTVTVAEKLRIIARDGGICMLALPGCLGYAQTADHRANRGQGGAGDVLDHGGNLIAACSLCNNAKENATGPARAALIARGITIRPDSTHRKTLLRALDTDVVAPDGRRFRLIDHDTRELVAA